jgi:hypothetical protein
MTHRYQSLSEIQSEQDPGFLVDVVTRRNGRLVEAALDRSWDEALQIAESAFAAGLTVDAEESTSDDADSPLPGEFDRQD